MQGFNDAIETQKMKAVNCNFDGPISVAFTVTRKCNFNCMHCYNNSGNVNGELSDEELLNIADQIGELQPLTVCICGGEPLLKSVTFDIIEKLSQTCGQVNLVSNGFIIDEEIIRRLKECKLSTLQISLDGDNEYLHDNFRIKRGSFDKVKNAIRLATKAGINTMVSFIPTRLNYRSFDGVCDLCFKLGATRVRTMPLIPMGRGREIKELVLHANEYLEFQQQVLRNNEKYENKGMAVEWGDPIDHLYRLPTNYKLGMDTYSMEVNPEGKIAITSYLPIYVGDCRKHSLKEYWNAGYKKIWGNKEVLKHTETIKNIYDFDKFEPTPYMGEEIIIDII